MSTTNPNPDGAGTMGARVPKDDIILSYLKSGHNQLMPTQTPEEGQISPVSLTESRRVLRKIDMWLVTTCPPPALRNKVFPDQSRSHQMCFALLLAHC
jgi:hypothetical protein